MMRSLWMRQLGALILKEFRQIVRDPSSYLVAGVLPLLFLFIFGFGISLDPGILQLAVLNQSGSMQSRSLEAAFANSPWFKTHPVRHMRDAEALMRDSAVQGVLVLHQDMDAALQRGMPASVMLIVDGTEPNVATFIQSYGQGVILRWQPLQGETEDALFKVQKGFLPALHDEAVENVAHGEQKFFEKTGFVHRLIFLL